MWCAPSYNDLQSHGFEPKDRGTERQFRFTRALLCTLLGVKSENTITNHIDVLINRGVVNDVKNLTSLNIKNENGNGRLLRPLRLPEVTYLYFRNHRIRIIK